MRACDTERLESEIRHVRDLLEGHKELDVLRHASEAQARDLAFREIERRLGEMNEFRAENLADRGKYITREVYEKFDDTTDTRLKMLENNRANLEGRMWMIGAVLVVINLAIKFFLK